MGILVRIAEVKAVPANVAAGRVNARYVEVEVVYITNIRRIRS